jgi:tetratricopeptide (TPR) repeat protein
MRTASRLTLLLAFAFASAFAAFAQPSADEALRVYEEGKVHYDARRYQEALERFDRAAELEPGKARWHYNRGLALRQLGRAPEARAALLRSRAIDPEYKRGEIDDKLAALEPGFAAPAKSAESTHPADSDGASGAGALVVGLAASAAGLALIAWLVVAGLRRSTRARSATPPSPGRRANDPAAVERVEQALATVAASLARCEHARSAGEDAEARAFVDRAANNLRVVRQGLPRAREGLLPVAELEQALARAHEASQTAEARLRALRGEAFEHLEGPRSGCFFCGRPLPTPESRHPLTLRLRGGEEPVLACATCARQAEVGQPPRVTVVKDGAQLKHWSQVEGFDPYLHAHRPFPGAQELPPWRLEGLGAASLGLGALAAGVGVGVGVTAAAVATARLLDLDAFEHAAAASEAAQAAASAAADRQSSGWADHS